MPQRRRPVPLRQLVPAGLASAWPLRSARPRAPRVLGLRSNEIKLLVCFRQKRVRSVGFCIRGIKNERRQSVCLGGHRWPAAANTSGGSCTAFDGPLIWLGNQPISRTERLAGLAAAGKRLGVEGSRAQSENQNCQSPSEWIANLPRRGSSAFGLSRSWVCRRQRYTQTGGRVMQATACSALGSPVVG